MIIPLLGNHEYTAYRVLKRLYSPIPEGENKLDYFNDNLSLFRDWTEDGGRVTYEDFGRLSEAEQKEFFDAIENMEVYAEIKCPVTTI